MTNITCFKCGKKGHIGAAVKTTKGSDGKSSKDSGKSSKDFGKASHDAIRVQVKVRKEKCLKSLKEQPEDETALDGDDGSYWTLRGGMYL